MSISDHIKKLGSFYENSQKEMRIGRDLIAPCLKECIRYRRGTATFSSSALRTYILSIDEILTNNSKIEILCAPEIDNRLLNALKTVTDDASKEKTISEFLDRFIGDAVGIKKAFEEGNKSKDPKYVEQIMCYLIANEIINIRFAVPLRISEIKASVFDEIDELSFDNINHQNMYHIKNGYFEFSGGAKLAIFGSVNETDSALSHNQELAMVFKSWVPGDAERCKQLVYKIDKDWGALEEKNENIRLYPIGKKILELIKSQSPNKRPKRPVLVDETQTTSSKANEPNHKYRHQDEAVKCFLENKNGILNMATGTGKTRTALKIVNELTNKGLIDQFIITCDGEHLLAQWIELLEQCADDESRKIFDFYPVIHTHKQGRKSFSLDPGKSILLVSINDVHNLEDMDKNILDRTLIIYDEVHDVGTIKRIDRLEALNNKISYKLGLSATPDKGEHNQEMTEAIEKSVGKIIFEFNLKDAIERGILCEFEYTVLDYYLNEDDKAEMARIQKSKYGREKVGNPMSQEEFAMAISAVYKASETKLESFEKHLSSNRTLLKSTIIFVYDKEYGQKVAEIVSEYTHNYSQFYGGNPRAILDDFKQDKIDVLVTCKAISQGIDIPNLRNVVLFSSDKQLGRTIQRLGRCLRNPISDEKKVAQVIDFSHIPEDESKSSYDEVRVKWFTELSKTKLKD